MDTQRLLHRFLIRLQDSILRYPGRVLTASCALLAFAIILGAGVEFRSSRSDLAPRDDPDQLHFEEIAAEFPGLSDLVACIEAAPGTEKSQAELRAFADALAQRFRADRQVSQVFHKLDLDWLSRHGLWLLPPESLVGAVEALRQQDGALEAVRSLRNLAGLNDLLAARLEKGMDAFSPPPEKEALAGIDAIVMILEWERSFLEDPAGSLAWLESGPPLLRLAGERPELASGGYLTTHDGRTLFIMVSPRVDDDSLPLLQAFVRSLRRATDEVGEERPGFRVSFTGEPAMTVEEMDAVRADTWTTALFASTGVVFLTLFVFRWRSHSLLVLAAIGIGVVWALGAVRLELGYLNMLTSSFISTLVGVGVAYSIHPVSEYELHGAHTGDPGRAVRAAYHATGAAVTTGGVTTAAAFFSILLMRFRGFSELGLVAGVGILLCLMAALVTLPALLVLYGRWRHARDIATHSAPAAVDRIWVERGAGKVCAFPRVTTTAGLLLTIALLLAGMGVAFDASLLNMLPRGAESVQYLERMFEDSDLSPSVNILVTGDLGALRQARERAAKEPTISQFNSALALLPEDPEASRAILAELSPLLDALRLPGDPAPSRREPLAASLRRLETALANAADNSFSAGLGSLAAPLEEARAKAEATADLVEAASPGEEAAWDAGEERLLTWAGGALEDLRAAAKTEAPVAEDLPAGIRDRFITREGRYVGLLHAADNIFDSEFLDEFVAASRRVAPEVTGFPVVFRTMSHRITSGFYRAASVAAVVVFLILLADFRSLRETGLALVPLAMGIAWMMGGMRLLGISYNFANLVAVPLIIGVGIDNGVHIVHRLRLEGASGMTTVLRHTGRAILIASLTTMIGFGSLSLASHRGLASLGAVLLLGVGACLISSMVILPNMLVAFGRVSR
jgi:hopanoid biosynthesis associated RND transporter like protein HpnN